MNTGLDSGASLGGNALGDAGQLIKRIGRRAIVEKIKEEVAKTSNKKEVNETAGAI